MKKQISKKKHFDNFSRRIKYFARACFWFTMLAVISETAVGFKPIPTIIAAIALIWVIFQVWYNLFSLMKYWKKEAWE